MSACDYRPVERGSRQFQQQTQLHICSSCRQPSNGETRGKPVAERRKFGRRSPIFSFDNLAHENKPSSVQGNWLLLPEIVVECLQFLQLVNTKLLQQTKKSGRIYSRALRGEVLTISAATLVSPCDRELLLVKSRCSLTVVPDVLPA